MIKFDIYLNKNGSRGDLMKNFWNKIMKYFYKLEHIRATEKIVHN